MKSTTYDNPKYQYRPRSKKMCIIVAKFFKGTGWTLTKNRDQDYVPDITFVDKKEKDVNEILVMYDKNTKYCEGMNHAGVCILSASLTPILKDETDDEDGEKIYDALKLSTPKEAVDYLQKKKLVGYFLVANKKECYLLEGVRDFNLVKGKSDKEYYSTLRKLPLTEVVVRTNHGTDFKWAGFHPGITELQDKYYKSSVNRQKIALKVAKEATKPEDIINGLCQKHDDDLQMNAFRVALKERQMRTIFQIMLVPNDEKMYIRPIQAKMDIHTDREHLSIEVFDNDVIKKYYGNQKFLRLAKIKRYAENGVTYIKCTEEFSPLGFKEIKQYLEV